MSKYLATLELHAPEGTTFEDAQQMLKDTATCAADKGFGIIDGRVTTGREREPVELWNLGSQGEPYRNESALHQTEGRKSMT